MPDHKVIIPPTSEPVTAEQSWAHLRLNVGDPVVAPADADDIALKLSTAREVAERFTGRALAPQTILLPLAEFPADEIELPMAPVLSITSVIYRDADGVDQTMDEADYQFDPYSTPPRLLPAVDTTWPVTKEGVNAVRITYEAGYASPGSPLDDPIPNSLLAAILLILGHLYENREDTAAIKLEEIPFGAQALMRPYRIHNGFA